jgi:hypothetical protein
MNTRHTAACLIAMVAMTIGVAPAGRVSAQGSQTASAQIEVAIRDTLRQYSTALAHLDADAVKKVQPSIEVENLRRAFKEMRALNVTIEDVRVLAADDTIARVSCKVNQTLTPKAGSKQTTAVTRVMRMRRQVGSWIIDGFER